MSDGMYLTNAEIDSCRDVFMKYDTDNSGSIDVTELRYVMDDMGHRVSDEDLFLMLTSVDDNGSGGIEFAEFLRLVVSNKQQSAERASEADTVDAFIALGGKDDKSGIVKTEKLKKVIKVSRTFSCPSSNLNTGSTQLIFLITCCPAALW